MRIIDKFCVMLVLVCSLLQVQGGLEGEYTKEFTDLVELVYGASLLSQGGTASVDMMFDGLSLDGKKILDIGSGLGGVDVYLAKQYAVEIIGIDRVERLVHDAQNRLHGQNLKGLVSFVYQDTDTSLAQFADNSFDIVFSKEALLHVEDKKAFLQEMYRVLKPGGSLIILDWLVTSHDLGANIRHMMEVDGLDLKMAMPEEYRSGLYIAGFSDVMMQNLNELYIDYTQNNLDTIQTLQAELIDAFGYDSYYYSIETWNLQKKIFQEREVLVSLLKAHKAR